MMCDHLRDPADEPGHGDREENPSSLRSGATKLFEAVSERARVLWRRARSTAKRSRVVTDAYRRGGGLYHRLRLRGVVDRRGADGMDPANVVWIFGSGRSGSTWLRRMLGGMPGHRIWEGQLGGGLGGGC